MMSRAAGIIQQPGARESISYLSTNELNSAPPAPPPPKIEVRIRNYYRTTINIICNTRSKNINSMTIIKYEKKLVVIKTRETTIVVE